MNLGERAKGEFRVLIDVQADHESRLRTGLESSLVGDLSFVCLFRYIISTAPFISISHSFV